MVSLGRNITPDRFVLTFDNLVQRTSFVHLLKNTLLVLNKRYNAPVEMEFAATITPTSGRANVTLHLLQCRPQSSLREAQLRPAPIDLAAADRLFISSRMVPQGQVSEVEYIFYVKPQVYSTIPVARRTELARIIGRLNKNLEGHRFIMVGPGRWGSANVDLGVPVSYADIYNASALIELAYSQKGITPEPSYGTHFFQDLVESQIYPLAVYPDQPGDLLNEEFFNRAKNQLAALLPEAADYADALKVFHVPGERPGCSLEIHMDGERALGYFAGASKEERRRDAPKQEVIVL
jgi:hypothetical protein